MASYTVRYKKTSSWLWSKILKVKGDGVFEKHRYFVTENEERIEVPTEDMLFKFSNGRFMVIKNQMEAEAGIKLPTRSKLESNT